LVSFDFDLRFWREGKGRWREEGETKGSGVDRNPATRITRIEKVGIRKTRHQIPHPETHPQNQSAQKNQNKTETENQ
jgi:hypothetical protein